MTRFAPDTWHRPHPQNISCLRHRLQLPTIRFHKGPTDKPVSPPNPIYCSHSLRSEQLLRVCSYLGMNVRAPLEYSTCQERKQFWRTACVLRFLRYFALRISILYISVAIMCGDFVGAQAEYTLLLPYHFDLIFL